MVMHQSLFNLKYEKKQNSHKKKILIFNSNFFLDFSRKNESRLVVEFERICPTKWA
jgi:hypothetical protein